MSNSNLSYKLACKSVAQLLKPPPKESPSIWIEQNRVLFSEASAEAGRMRLDRTPYAREVLDLLVNDDCHTVVLRWASQVGKTELLLSALCWMIKADPGPALFILPSTSMAQGVSRDRIGPMIMRTPALAGLVSESKSRDSDNTQFRKAFVNGRLTIVSASSVDGLVGRPIRFLFCDEIDRYEGNVGGDPLAQAQQRTASFSRRKLFLSGTPLLAGFSRIDAQFLRGDQRHWHVSCLDCGEVQTMVWDNVEFKSSTETFYRCRACNYSHSEEERRIMTSAGEWIPTAQGEPGVRSYHLNALSSLMPGSSLNALARLWFDIHKRPEARRTFLNEKLAQSWEEEGDSALAGDPVIINTTGLNLPVIAATDVQGDRLETTLIAVNDEKLFVIDHVSSFGDPTKPDVWKDLDKLRVEWKVRAHAIDCGYLQEAVLAWVQPRMRGVTLAVKGEAGGIGNPLVKKRSARSHRSSVPIRLINVDEAKLRVQARIGTEALVFSDALPRDYFDQLASERLVATVRRGLPTRVWRKKEGERNEALDCLAYVIGLLDLLGGRVPSESNPSNNLEQKDQTAPNTDKGKKRKGFSHLYS